MSKVITGRSREHANRQERTGWMATKRQQTFAKMNRERAVREKRARKQEKREERKAKAAGELETATEFEGTSAAEQNPES
jgi:hypothetical protein